MYWKQQLVSLHYRKETERHLGLKTHLINEMTGVLHGREEKGETWKKLVRIFNEVKRNKKMCSVVPENIHSSPLPIEFQITFHGGGGSMHILWHCITDILITSKY